MPQLRKILVLLILGTLFAWVPSGSRAQGTDPVLVFAAASLADVMEDVGDAYRVETGSRIVFSFAGSMTLARQIEASSGADVFISADSETMDYLEVRNLIETTSRIDLLANELVLISPADAETSLSILPGFDLHGELGDGRLAVANTLAVPAGRYARAALENLGVWEGVASALAEAEDVRAALALVARGEAPLGIVYATDAMIEPRVRIVATFPENSHPPIRYPAALTRDARSGAAEFLAYLKGDAAAGIFEAAGFRVVSP
jgi:molybdate transport system substrate-binding protein